MTNERPAPRGVDASTPNVARMYDYALGGKDNFAADREAAEEVFRIVPESRTGTRENRAFLRRAVRFLAEEAGIRQFLDLGSGLPTQDNVHQVAQRHAPDARVLYVDYDPVVCTHGRALLATDAQTVTLEADIRRPDEILDSPELRGLIDLDRPVAVLCVATLHFITDDAGPAGIVARFRDATVPGSYLVISHVGGDRRTDAVERGVQVYQGASSPMTPRSHEEVEAFFEGYEPEEPGIVTVPEWRPERRYRRRKGDVAVAYAGVGRKP